MRKVLGVGVFLAFVAALSADVIKVGAILPLSGEYAFVGSAVREGMQLAVEEAKPTRHDYRIIFEDGQFNLSQTALITQKLINVDKVDIVTSMWGPSASVVCPITERKKVVHLADDWNMRWTTNYAYTWNLCSPIDEYAQMQLKMLKKWGAKRIAFIYQNTADWSYAAPIMVEAIKRDPSMTLAAKESFNSPVRDFRTMLAKIRQTNPDVIMVWSLLPESEIILKQARELGIDCRFTGYYEDLSDRKLGEGMSFICFTNPAGKFLESYRAKYNREAPYSCNIGYDQMTAIICVCEKFETKPSAEALLEATKDMEPWQGASGTVTPRKDRIISLQLKAVKYVNGVMVEDPEFEELNK